MARKPVPRTEAAPAPAPEAGGGKVIKIKYAKVDPATSAVVPERKYGKDAGLDLSVARPVSVMPGAKVLVDTNLAIAVPAGYYGLIVGRSSLLYQRGLMVNLGVIDAGYRGAIQILTYNPSKRSVTLFEGDRIAQLLLLPLVPVLFEEEELSRLPEGDRGPAGFGSTGGYTDEDVPSTL